jgi:hypothetical protein
MKNYTRTLKNNAGCCLALASILAASGLGAADSEQKTDQPSAAAAKSNGGGGAGGGFAVGGNSGQNGIAITSIDPTVGYDLAASKDQAWLGVSIEESTEALTSQLGLARGAGLVVTYVAPDSPAAKAGFEKNDVLAELDGQLLVVPAQLRKLVQVRKQGDTIELVFYRGGKKQTASATLGKAPAGFSRFEGGHPWDGESGQFVLPFGPYSVGQQMKAVKGALSNVKIDTAKVQEEVRRSLEQARKAWQEAVRASSNVDWAPAVKAYRELLRSGIDVNNNASVTVRSTGQRAKSVVKADESGTIVLVSNPKPYLTAHDKDGKLLFDGEIDTPEQRAKVPPELWEKVEPLLDKVAPRAEEEPETDTVPSKGTSSTHGGPAAPTPPSDTRTLWSAPLTGGPNRQQHLAHRPLGQALE